MSIIRNTDMPKLGEKEFYTIVNYIIVYNLV